MNEAERGQRITERKEKLVSGLEAHIASLEELATTTDFDFDVATDIHPHLLDDTPAGKKQLEVWQKLYVELTTGPKTLVTMRWNNSLARGCYGFGQEAQYETNALWLRVYEDVEADDLEFAKGDSDTASRVFINRPHDLMIWDTNGLQQVTEAQANSSVLYQERMPNDTMMSSMLERAIEPFATNEEFAYGLTLHEAVNRMERSIDERISLNARMSISKFLFSDDMRQRRSGR